MTTWYLFSLGGLLFLGLGDFIKKLVIKKGGDKDVFLFMCFVFYLIGFIINLFLVGTYDFNPYLLKSAFVVGFFDAMVPVGMLASLKYLDSSLTFISVRIITSFLILFIGIYILGDVVSIYKLVGFFIGLIAIYFLSGWVFGNKLLLNKKGIIALIITIIGVTGGHSYFKYVVSGVDISSFMLVKFIVSFLFVALYMVLRKKFQNFNTKEIKKVTALALLSGIIFVIHFLFILPNMYLLGPVSISYKFISYSIVVPIVLSILFLGEKLTKKKIFAFFLTFLSLLLFMF